MTVSLTIGDSRVELRAFMADSFDSCVTDPPYALTSIVKRFGKANAAPAKGNDAFMRASAGFMGQAWDNGETAFDPEFWKEVFRVLKPGAHLVAFSGTRTYHRMVCAIEDAGFEIRDQIGWAYGSGFPKSHDVSKGIDKRAGAEREAVAVGPPVKRMIPGADQNKDGWEKTDGRDYVPSTSRPATPDAERWEGWGTALKPAWEPIVVARKPLIGTVAENVLEHGTGAINIDACRIEYASEDDKAAAAAAAEQRSRQSAGRSFEGWGMEQQKLTAADYISGAAGKGRWPANIVHDGSEEVLAAFPSEAGAFAPVRGTEPSNAITNVYGARERTATLHHGDSGSAARFFYTAKADAEDRMGSKHPTVKPIDLMRWLVRLVTPKGGCVLDPFAGSGTTGVAAKIEGCDAHLIEREERFAADIRTRLDHADGKAAHSVGVKMRNKRKEPDGPLFGKPEVAA